MKKEKMCSNFFRCSNPWPYTYQKERIMKKTYLVPRKKTEKKCLLKSKLLQNRLCVFFRQNFSSHLHLKIFKKRNLCTWNKIIFFQGKRDLFSFKKKLWEAHEKLRFFRQNFFKKSIELNFSNLHTLLHSQTK